MKTRLITMHYPKRAAKPLNGFAASQRGYTIVEIIVTLTIAAILIGLAVPSFQDVIRDNRVLSGANSLAAGISLAKSEAIKRSRAVTLCPSTDATACNAGASFDQGWVVVVEKTGVARLAAPDPDPAVGTNGTLMGGSAMQEAVVTRTPAGAQNWIRFTSRGLVDEAVTLSVKPTTCKSGYAFQDISVGIAGRVSVSKKKC